MRGKGNKTKIHVDLKLTKFPHCSIRIKSQINQLKLISRLVTNH